MRKLPGVAVEVRLGNSGSKVWPSALKKVLDLARSLTAMVAIICLCMVLPFI